MSRRRTCSCNFEIAHRTPCTASIRECQKVLKQAGAISNSHMTLHRCYSYSTVPRFFYRAGSSCAATMSSVRTFDLSRAARS
jgi:hypothetical protein